MTSVQKWRLEENECTSHSNDLPIDQILTLGNIITWANSHNTTILKNLLRAWTYVDHFSDWVGALYWLRNTIIHFWWIKIMKFWYFICIAIVSLNFKTDIIYLEFLLYRKPIQCSFKSKYWSWITKFVHYWVRSGVAMPWLFENISIQSMLLCQKTHDIPFSSIYEEMQN